MLQISFIILFRISPKIPSLCLLLFFYAANCHHYSLLSSISVPVISFSNIYNVYTLLL